MPLRENESVERKYILYGFKMKNILGGPSVCLGPRVGAGAADARARAREARTLVTEYAHIVHRQLSYTCSPLGWQAVVANDSQR